MTLVKKIKQNSDIPAKSVVLQMTVSMFEFGLSSCQFHLPTHVLPRWEELFG